MQKLLSLLAASSMAFVTISAVQAPPHLPPRPEARSSDVLCNEQTGDTLYAPQRVAPAMNYAPPPPPPPVGSPPVPSPMVAYDVAESSVAVTGSQMALPAVSAPHENRERYAGKEIAAVQRAAEAPVSTFSVDVDTGSYANARRFLVDGGLPPKDSVRTEEFLNYFRYDYPRPADARQPFSVTTDVARTPWNADTRLLRIGIRGYDVPRAARPAANLVFLVDVSGSMDEPDKLPLVKAALTGLADKLNPADRVAIVVYAGAAGVVLKPTASKAAIKAAIACLDAGGSTAGGEGIELAYAMARAAFLKDGINRVILCTDGDFNVGTTSDEALQELVKKQRDSGITLTTLGFGTGNYNDSMMEKIADVGNGNYGYVDSANEARKLLERELSSTLFTIAQDVKVQVEFNPALVAEYRLVGYENRALREEDFANDKVDAGDIGAGHQVTALYEIVPAGGKGWLSDRRYALARPVAASRTDEAAWLKLRYKLPGQQTSRLIEQPIAASQIAAAGPATGDFAFAAAVGAFGQRLRGDPALGQFSLADIRTLAGSSSDDTRREFLNLVSLAQGRKLAAREGSE